MKTNLKVLCCVLAGFICYGFMNGPEDNNSSLVSAVAMQQDNNLQEQAAEIFQKNCAVTGCHTGKYAKRRLNLGPEFFVNNLVDVQSRQIDSLLRVDTTNPQQSYMLIKIRGDEGIAGERMPLDSPPLSYSDIKTIESWVYSLSDQSLDEGYTREQAAEARTEFEQSPFWGTRVINLPTTTNIGEHDLLFRVSHRFFFPIKEGYEVYWGLNGPADVLLSLGFGITKDVSISIGHE
ncbi:hypothetical protein GF337_00650, partial [candidate division KSB1 bacterium]|nr:hypothetical protein [candidate division KSB1 bacterium]